MFAMETVLRMFCSVGKQPAGQAILNSTEKTILELS